MRKVYPPIRYDVTGRCKGGCTFKLGKIRRRLVGSGKKHLDTKKVCDNEVHAK